MKLAGKTALVTGGASGIGLEIARLFAANGATVGILDLADVLPAAAAAVMDAAGAWDYAQCDVADPKTISTALARLGPATILVNCAGIDEVAGIEDVSPALWNRMLAVHLTGSFLMCQAVLPAMRAAGWGRIINISSQLAHRGMAGMVPYCAAKAGVIGLTKALAHEVAAEGITVNCLNPGPVDTPLVRSLPPDVVAAVVAQLPLRRLGTVAEVAGTALLLASDEGAFYVGASMNMNGGHYMI